MNLNFEVLFFPSAATADFFAVSSPDYTLVRHKFSQLFVLHAKSLSCSCVEIIAFQIPFWFFERVFQIQFLCFLFMKIFFFLKIIGVNLPLESVSRILLFRVRVNIIWVNHFIGRSFDFQALVWQKLTNEKRSSVKS